MPFELISFNTGGEWIGKLWSKFKSIRSKYEQEINEINDIMFTDPEELAKYYVEPNCQETNPADHHEERFLTATEPMMKKIDQFFGAKVFQPGDNQLFVLSDAGMGKSALLTMLKLMHLTAFWPSGKDCVLKKLGKKTLDEIAGIKEKRETILLLDSLDEDPTAYGRVRERLSDILQATQAFFRVIITCRTQFFLPDAEHDPFRKPGVAVVAGFRCPVKYLSFFDDSLVEKYLLKRFPPKLGLFPDKKVEEACKFVAKMGSLKCRPMLLSYIEELIESPMLKKERSEYHIYEALIESWLNRENTKHPDISQNNLFYASIILATLLQMNGLREISEEKLDKLILQISKLKPIKEIDLKGRSLLNRNSEGDFRFSHYSIQEFLVAKLLLSDKPVFYPSHPIRLTDFIFRMMLISKRFSKFPKLINLFDFSGLNFNKFDLKSAYVMNTIGMKFVFIPPGEFTMGSPKKELGQFDNEIHHKTILTSAFFMQTTPITRGQWRKVMREGNLWDCDTEYPVQNLSWDEVQDFIKELNRKEETDKYRLPTEIEWEYACRAGSTTAYCFGDDESRLKEYAWYNENSDKEMHPVGLLKPNEWGLYDMHGNVWEWCRNYYEAYLLGSAPVLRGGCNASSAKYCRSATRHIISPGGKDISYGFRLVRDV